MEINYSEIAKAQQALADMRFEIYGLIVDGKLTEDAAYDALARYEAATRTMRLPPQFGQEGRFTVLTLGDFSEEAIQAWVGDIHGRIPEGSSYTEMVEALRTFLQEHDSTYKLAKGMY